MRVLYLTHRVPYAPNRGDRIRAYHTLRYLRACGIDVHLVALAHDADEHARADALSELASSYEVVRVPRRRNLLRAVTAAASSRPLTHVLLDGPAMRSVLRRCVATFAPDVVLAYCSGMARFALEPPLAGLPFVLDMVDVDSEKWRRLGGSGPAVLRAVYRREWRWLAAFERRAAHAAARVLVVNDREREAIVALAPDARVTVVSNGVDLDYFRRPAMAAREPLVVFVGVLEYEPNAAGARWLVEQVWPLVSRRHSDARLVVVGRGVPQWLRDRAGVDPSIVATGEVGDVRPYLWRASVAAAPLFVARGLQNKVLEALAADLPVVVTSPVAAGLPIAAARACATAETPDAFADAVAAQLTAGGSATVSSAVADLAWPRALAALPVILQDTIARGPAVTLGERAPAIAE